MYYVPLAIVGICAIIESKIKRKKIPFYIAFAVMSLFLILRYGQGTDYFGYLGNYELWDYHSEIGFLTLERVFHAIGCPFEVFAILIAVFHMTCTFRAINLYSPYKCFSLMLLYPDIFNLLFFGSASGNHYCFLFRVYAEVAGGWKMDQIHYCLYYFSDDT